MDFDKNQLAIIIIAILMVTSIIGFAFWMSPLKEQQQQPSAPEPEATVVNFEAENISATVKNILPVLKIVAVSTEVNISEIEKSLVSLDEVQKLASSRFEKDPQTGALIYASEIVLKSKEIDATETVSVIEQKTSLKDIYAAKKALLKLPSTVKLYNATLDLNKVYTFRQPFSEGLIELDSIAGDELKIHLSVSLKGEEIVGVPFSYEVENTSAKIQQFSVKANAEILSLTPSLVFSGTFDYNGFNFKDLNKQIASNVSDNNFVKIDHDVFLPDANLLIDLNSIKELGFDKDVFKKDLKNYASLNKAAVTSVQFSEDEDRNILTMEAKLSTMQAYDGFVAIITDFLSGKGLQQAKDFAFETKQLYLEGEVQIEDIQKIQEAAEQLADILIANGILLRIDNVVNVSLTESLKTETREEFPYEEEFHALLLPKHSAGEELELVINFFTQRGKVTYAQGIEKIDIYKEMKKAFTGGQ